MLKTSRAARHRQHRPGVSPVGIFRRRKMNFLRFSLFGLVALILVLALIGWYKPSQFEVQRIKLVRAKPADVYAAIAAPSTWPRWHPWIDSSTQGYAQELGGPERGVGAWIRWQSQESQGRLELTQAAENQRVEFLLDLEGMPCTGAIVIEPLGEVTRVRTEFHGDVGGDLVLRYLLPIYEKTLGRSLGLALDQLAANVEGSPAR